MKVTVGMGDSPRFVKCKRARTHHMVLALPRRDKRRARVVNAPALRRLRCVELSGVRERPLDGSGSALDRDASRVSVRWTAPA